MAIVFSVLAAVVVTAFVAVLAARAVTARRDLGTAAEHATYATLHTAWSAAPPLRAGLASDSIHKAVGHLRLLLGTPALALTDTQRVLAWDGSDNHHESGAFALAGKAISSGRTEVFTIDPGDCPGEGCALRQVVVVPMLVDGIVVGTMAAYSAVASSGLIRATDEVARWASGQLELAELDRSKTMVAEAEVRALRAQISPHFIYNSLSAIASFVRTDPDRARRLLIEFADFTRYSFRRHGDFTTLAEELRSIDQYLMLERARFGSRLRVHLQIAPEVLPVAVPFLCLQPLVENAVQHGMEESGPGPCNISIVAIDGGANATVSIEDDGMGMDPNLLSQTLHGVPGGTGGIALTNIDERLRQIYGQEYGLVIETALGAGTKVNIRIPKYHPGVRAS